MTQAKTGDWITNPEGYRAKLNGLLNGRDPIEIMTSTADVVQEIINQHSIEQLRAKPDEGKWTPNEIIGHLLDAEWVIGFRIRLVLCEDKPVIHGMDQDLWVSGQDHNNQEPQALLDAFRNLRNVNLDLWKRMSAEQLDRPGMHEQRGAESLRTTLSMYAGHDLTHIDQMRRYISATEKK